MSEQTLDAAAINDLRRRVLEGGEYTKEELRAGVFTLIGERVAAAQATATASTRRPSQRKAINLDDML